MDSFITELCYWIEKNLGKKITLDDMSVKSGYSKWYLQRLFRSETGLPLATYMRQRRLYKAAVMLKMTEMPVVDIVFSLGFSTQQTFTRTFTQHFGQAPGRYRSEPYWNFRGLQSDLKAASKALPMPELVTRGPRLSPDIRFSYLCSGEDFDHAEYHYQKRSEFYLKAESILKEKKALCVSEYCEPAGCGNKIRFVLTFGTFSEFLPAAREDESFLKFQFKGTPKQLTEMQFKIYQHVMPERSESRRAGSDLFVTTGMPEHKENNHIIDGLYYVPVSPGRISSSPVSSASQNVDGQSPLIKPNYDKFLFSVQENN